VADQDVILGVRVEFKGSDDGAVEKTAQSYELLARNFKEYQDAHKKGLEDLAKMNKKLDEEKQAAERLGISVDELREREAKRREDLEKLMTTMSQLDKATAKYNETISLLSKSLEAGDITGKKYSEMMAKATEEHKKAISKGKETTGVFASLGKFIMGKVAVVLSLAGAFLKLYETFKEGFFHYIEEERRIRGIIGLMETFGGASSEQVKAVHEWAEGMQKVGVSTSEAYQHLQHMIPAAGSAENAMRAVGLAMDIAATTGRDLSTVQRGLEMLMLGNTYALTSVRGGLFGLADGSKGATEALRELNEMYGGTNRLLDDHKRTVDMVASAWDNLKDRMGKEVATLMDVGIWLGEITNGFHDFYGALHRAQVLGVIKGQVADAAGAFKSWSALVKESRGELEHLNSETAHLASLKHRGLISETEYNEKLAQNKDRLKAVNAQLKGRTTLMEAMQKKLYDMKGMDLPHAPGVSDKGREAEDEKADAEYDKAKAKASAEAKELERIREQARRTVQQEEMRYDSASRREAGDAARDKLAAALGMPRVSDMEQAMQEYAALRTKEAGLEIKALETAHKARVKEIEKNTKAETAARQDALGLESGSYEKNQLGVVKKAEADITKAKLQALAVRAKAEKEAQANTDRDEEAREELHQKKMADVTKAGEAFEAQVVKIATAKNEKARKAEQEKAKLLLQQWLTAIQDAADKEVDIEKLKAAALGQIDEETTKSRIMSAMGYVDSAMGLASTLFEHSKAVQIALAVASGARAVVEALPNYYLAAIAAATAAAEIVKIEQTEIGSGAGSSSVGGGNTTTTESTPTHYNVSGRGSKRKPRGFDNPESDAYAEEEGSVWAEDYLHYATRGFARTMAKGFPAMAQNITNTTSTAISSTTNNSPRIIVPPLNAAQAYVNRKSLQNTMRQAEIDTKRSYPGRQSRKVGSARRT
jgi:hypothetical protein